MSKEDDFRKHEGDEQLELFETKKKREAVPWAGLCLIAFFIILLAAGASGLIN